MDEKTPPSNNTPPMQELSDTLRPAVEQVRAAEPPAEAVERSVDRGQKLGPPPRRRSRRWLAYIAIADLAAAIFICFWLWPDQGREAAEPDLTRKEYAKAEDRERKHARYADNMRQMKIADGIVNTIFVAEDHEGEVPKKSASGGRAGYQDRMKNEQGSERKSIHGWNYTTPEQPQAAAPSPSRRQSGGRENTPADTSPQSQSSYISVLRTGVSPGVIDWSNLTPKPEDEAKKVRPAKTPMAGTFIGNRHTDLQKNQPQVWYRDRGRPTFARVYIGDGNSLELVSLHVSVTIEGPRARTVVDHIFRNPHNRQLEGNFEYPLPSGASPSYFAMFLGQTRDTVPAHFGRRGEAAPLPAEALARMTPEELVKHVDATDWGRLQEGRIVGKEKALETYEDVVRGRIDPALLEYTGGNTFSGRFFPISPKGYNRVILAYEELLPFAQEHMIYRFPLPGRKLNELQFSLQAKVAECVQPVVTCSDSPANRQRKLPGEEHGGRITFNRTWKDSQPEGEVMFACTPARVEVQAVSGRQGDNGPRYVYARLRPLAPCGVPAGYLAERASRTLRRQHETAPDNLGNRQ